MAIETKYYSLNWKNDNKETSSAYYEDEGILNFELIPQLEGKNVFPKQFYLKKVSETSKGIEVSDHLDSLEEIWPDYLPNDLAWPLMSKKMMVTINKELSELESVDWVEAIVNHNNLSQQYFVPRFNKNLDTLDSKKTKYIPGTDLIMTPSFSKNKIAKYNIFHKPDSPELFKITPSLYVSETIKNNILREQLTGINLEEIKTY